MLFAAQQSASKLSQSEVYASEWVAVRYLLFYQTLAWCYSSNASVLDIFLAESVTKFGLSCIKRLRDDLTSSATISASSAHSYVNCRQNDFDFENGRENTNACKKRLDDLLWLDMGGKYYYMMFAVNILEFGFLSQLLMIKLIIEEMGHYDNFDESRNISVSRDIESDNKRDSKPRKLKRRNSIFHGIGVKLPSVANECLYDGYNSVMLRSIFEKMQSIYAWYSKAALLTLLQLRHRKVICGITKGNDIQMGISRTSMEQVNDKESLILLVDSRNAGDIVTSSGSTCSLSHFMSDFIFCNLIKEIQPRQLSLCLLAAAKYNVRIPKLSVLHAVRVSQIIERHFQDDVIAEVTSGTQNIFNSTSALPAVKLP
jgi:hypothetical protein